MFEKILLEKIGTAKFRFYKQLPQKIKYKIEDAWHNAQRTKKYSYITVNWHSSEWWENEFDRLLNIFIY